jgi:hypothetical protein
MCVIAIAGSFSGANHPSASPAGDLRMCWGVPVMRTFFAMRIGTGTVCAVKSIVLCTEPGRYHTQSNKIVRRSGGPER